MQKRKWVFLLIFTFFLLSTNRIDAQFDLTGPVDYEKLFVENLSRGGKVLNLSGKKIGEDDHMAKVAWGAFAIMHYETAGPLDYGTLVPRDKLPPNEVKTEDIDPNGVLGF